MKPFVLVIEDDSDIAALVTKNLEAVGFSCEAARDGESGLEMLQQQPQRQPPSLVILDITLPGIDGHEVVRRIRQHSSVPILMLTARTSDSDKVLGFELGHELFLEAIQAFCLFLCIVERIRYGEASSDVDQPIIQLTSHITRPLRVFRVYVILLTGICLQIVELILTGFIIMYEFPSSAQDRRGWVATLVAVVGIMPEIDVKN